MSARFAAANRDCASVIPPGASLRELADFKEQKSAPARLLLDAGGAGSNTQPSPQGSLRDKSSAQTKPAVRGAALECGSLLPLFLSELARAQAPAQCSVRSASRHDQSGSKLPHSKAPVPPLATALLILQRHQGIDLRCAPRGNVTCQKSDGQHQERHKNECCRVGRLDGK